METGRTVLEEGARGKGGEGGLPAVATKESADGSGKGWGGGGGKLNGK
jgi:hypothetical protein